MSARLHRFTGRLVGAVGVVAVLALAGGCGEDAPTEQVPELSARLDAVDAAVAAHDYAQARRALNQLAHTAYDARQSGDLSQDQADQILAAAETLRRAIPSPAPSGTVTPTPSPSPSTSPSPSPSPSPSKPSEPSDEHDEHDKGDKPGKGHDHGHGHEKD